MVMVLADDVLATIQSDEERSLQRVRNGIIRAKSHFFRFARYNLTLIEQKVIYYAIMTGEQKKKPFSPVVMPVQTFMALTGYDGGGRTYERIRNAASSLTKKNVEVAYKDAKGQVKYIAMPWLTRVQYNTGDGTVEIVPNPELQEHFSGKPFTSEEYYYLFKFKCQYSARLYELLKAHAFKPLADFSVDDLRARLGVEDGKYTQFTGLRARVLSPALSDINEYTDLNVEMRERKGKWGSVTTVYFAIAQKEGVKRLAQREDEGLLPAKGKKRAAADEDTMEQLMMSFMPAPDEIEPGQRQTISILSDAPHEDVERVQEYIPLDDALLDERKRQVLDALKQGGKP